MTFISTSRYCTFPFFIYLLIYSPCRSALEGIMQAPWKRRRGGVDLSWWGGRWCVCVCVCVSDTDECRLAAHECGAHSDCVNTQGSYHCECVSGYVPKLLSNNTIECIGKQAS